MTKHSTLAAKNTHCRHGVLQFNYKTLILHRLKNHCTVQGLQDIVIYAVHTLLSAENTVTADTECCTVFQKVDDATSEQHDAILHWSLESSKEFIYHRHCR